MKNISIVAYACKTILVLFIKIWNNKKPAHLQQIKPTNLTLTDKKRQSVR